MAQLRDRPIVLVPPIYAQVPSDRYTFAPLKTCHAPARRSAPAVWVPPSPADRQQRRPRSARNAHRRTRNVHAAAVSGGGEDAVRRGKRQTLCRSHPALSDLVKAEKHCRRRGETHARGDLPYTNPMPRGKQGTPPPTPRPRRSTTRSGAASCASPSHYDQREGSGTWGPSL